MSEIGSDPYSNIIPDNNNTNPAIVPDTNQFEGSFKTQRTPIDLELTQDAKAGLMARILIHSHVGHEHAVLEIEKKKGNLAAAGLIGLALVI